METGSKKHHTYTGGDNDSPILKGLIIFKQALKEGGLFATKSMKYKFFTYPVPPPEEPTDLNAFLSSTRVLSVQSHMVTKDRMPYLVFIVEFLDQGKMEKTSQPRVDYREKLSEEEFVLFSQLRDLRKKMADQEGVPVYAVFTNAQLAQMVEMRIKSQQELLSITGVGKSKVEKYGKGFIKLCQDIFQGTSNP